MKFEAFATLEAVLRLGSFAAAASEVSLTPSAVSMQMKQLEAYLGMPLFDRSGLQIRPRPAAIELAGAMRDGLRHVDSMRRRPTMALEGAVRLGIIDSMLAMLLPGTLRRIQAQHERLVIRPSRGRSGSLIADLKAGQIDGAVVAMPGRGALSRLRWRLLQRRALVLIAPPDTVATRPVDLIRSLDWIRYDRSAATGRLAARYVAERVADKRARLELDAVAGIVALVSRGLGFSLLHLPDPALCQAYPVRVLGLGASGPVMDLVLATRKEDDDDRALAAVHAALGHTLAEDGAAG